MAGSHWQRDSRTAEGSPLLRGKARPKYPPYGCIAMSSDNEGEEDAIVQEREVAAEPDVKAVDEAEEEADELEEEVEEETEEKESEKIEDRLDEKQSSGGKVIAGKRRGKKKVRAKKPSAKKAKRKPKPKRRSHKLGKRRTASRR